jgi:hypothetical protein
MMPEAGGASLDDRDHDGKPVRTHFRFSEPGKIISTACAPAWRLGLGRHRHQRFDDTLFVIRFFEESCALG